MDGIQIGQVSEETGLSVDAIRFYEKQRLLQPSARTDGGFRLFRGDHVQRIRFIRSAQQLGFSLTEIRELLILQGDHRQACSHVRDLLRVKVRAVRRKILELELLEGELKKSLRKCERNLKASPNCRRNACPALQTISGRRI